MVYCWQMQLSGYFEFSSKYLPKNMISITGLRAPARPVILSIAYPTLVEQRASQRLGGGYLELLRSRQGTLHSSLGDSSSRAAGKCAEQLYVSMCSQLRADYGKPALCPARSFR